MSRYEGYVTLLNIQDEDAGQDAQRYQLETNQEEILRYYTGEGEAWRLSPNKLVVSLYEIVPESSEGKAKRKLSLKDLKVFVLVEDGEWESVESVESFTSSDNDIFIDLNSISESYSNFSYLRLSYTLTSDDRTFIAEKRIGLRNATTDELAKLALKADGIYASVADSALEFSSSGLVVRNGALSLVKHDYVLTDGLTEEEFNIGTFYEYDGQNYVLAKEYNQEKVYYTREEELVLYGDDNGNLTIAGVIYATDGDFTGTIHAKDGEFAGTIEARDGKIGGFKIKDGYLCSNDEVSIRLDGKEGSILANDITLGRAVLSDYMTLGDKVKISNPDIQDEKGWARGYFLQVLTDESKPAMTFYNNGQMILGDLEAQILLDGPNQQIRGWMPGTAETVSSWLLSPSKAEFNNIIARGSIKAAVFEYGRVSAIGGAMLMRPSSRIVSFEYTGTTQTKVILESTLGFKELDTCLIEQEITSENVTSLEATYCTILEVLAEEKAIVIDKVLTAKDIGATIIDFGGNGSVAIGLNGASKSVYDMAPGAISVMEYSKAEDGNKYIPRLILGKLPEGNIYGQAAGSYGLYAENVVLNGQLTTRTRNNNGISNNYSGIGTNLREGAPSSADISEAKKWFPSAELGQILLWAGAPSDSKQDIEKSKFFVDEYGNMYAGSGYFDGTIITNSTIEAAEIKTAILTGAGESGVALKIQDAANGIQFFRGEKPVFSLGTNGLTISNLEVAINGKCIIDSNGNLTAETLSSNSTIKAEEDAIIGGAIELSGAKIYNTNTELAIVQSYQSDENAKNLKNLIIDSSGLKLEGSLFYMKEGQIKGEIKQVVNNINDVIGYDLYIY